MLIMNVFAELKGFIRTYARISAYLSVHVVDPETELLGIQLERRIQKLLQVFFRCGKHRRTSLRKCKMKVTGK